MKETLLLTKHMRENPEDSHSLKSYEKNGGYESVKKVLKSGTPEEVLQEIKDSNIRGRGGAGFPTGVKWGFLAEDEERYLVNEKNSISHRADSFKKLIAGCFG